MRTKWMYACCLSRRRPTHHAQEESGQQEPLEILCQRSKTRNECPQGHTKGHVVRRASAGQEHIAGHLPKDVADEEDRDTGLVLRRGQIQVIFDVVDAGQSDSIAVLAYVRPGVTGSIGLDVTNQVVQPVHSPSAVCQSGLRETICATHSVGMIQRSSFFTNAISAGSVFSFAPE